MRLAASTNTAATTSRMHICIARTTANTSSSSSSHSQRAVCRENCNYQPICSVIQNVTTTISIHRNNPMVIVVVVVIIIIIMVACTSTVSTCNSARDRGRGLCEVSIIITFRREMKSHHKGGKTEVNRVAQTKREADVLWNT